MRQTRVAIGWKRLFAKSKWQTRVGGLIEAINAMTDRAALDYIAKNAKIDYICATAARRLESLGGK